MKFQAIHRFFDMVMNELSLHGVQIWVRHGDQYAEYGSLKNAVEYAMHDTTF
jgi:hypothetical protein